MRSYDYEKRDGVEEINWVRFAELSRELAAGLRDAGVDSVVGVARAGLIPAAAIACALRCELFPVRVTRRRDDSVVHERPVWKTDVPQEVEGRCVAVVDEIVDTGETLAMVASRARELGARSVVTAVLVSHTWADPAPDLAGLSSDALVVFPWDARVLVDGEWQLHPELRAAADALRHPGRSVKREEP